MIISLCLAGGSVVAAQDNVCQPTDGAGSSADSLNTSILCVHFYVEAGRLVVDPEQSWFEPSARFERLSSYPEQQIIRSDSPEGQSTTLQMILLEKVSQTAAQLEGTWTDLLKAGLPDEQSLARVLEQSGSWVDFAGFLFQEGYEPEGLMLDYLDFVKGGVGASLAQTTPLFFMEREDVPILPEELENGFAPYRVADPVDLDALVYRFPGLPEADVETERQRVIKTLQAYQGRLWNRPAIRHRLVESYRTLGIRLAESDVQLAPPDRQKKYIEATFTHIDRVLLPLSEKDDITIDKILYLMLPDRGIRTLPPPGDSRREHYISRIEGLGDVVMGISYEQLAGRSPLLNQRRLQLQQLQLVQLGYAVEVQPSIIREGFVDLVVVRLPESSDKPATTTPDDSHAAGREAVGPRPARRVAGEHTVLDPGHEDPALQTSPVPSADASVTRRKKNYIGAGVSYQPGQGIRFFGLFQRTDVLGGYLGLKVGGHDGEPLVTGEYNRDFALFRGIGRRRLSVLVGGFSEVEADRLLDGERMDERRSGARFRLELELFRDRNGHQLRFYSESQSATVGLSGKQTRTQEQRLVYVDVGSRYRWQSPDVRETIQWMFSPRLRFGIGAASDVPSFFTVRVTGHVRRRLAELVALDVSGTTVWVKKNTPIYERASIGGAESLRGFRRDDAVGRRSVSVQPELWMPLPGTTGASDGFRAFLKHRFRFALFTDTGWIAGTTASRAGWRSGPGCGLRFIYEYVVLRLDWAYGFFDDDFGDGQSRIYFSISTDAPF